MSHSNHPAPLASIQVSRRRETDPNPTPFDAWLRHALAERHASVLREPLPERFLDLIAESERDAV